MTASKNVLDVDKNGISQQPKITNHPSPLDSGNDSDEHYDHDEEHEEHETPTRGLSVDPLHSSNLEPSTDEEDGRLSRTVSQSSKAVSVKEVPRSQRSGFLAFLSLLYEAEEPKNYPRKVKWLITFIVSIAAMVAPMGSSIIYPALPQITTDFNTTAFQANFSVALYLLSMSIFPLWWSSFSEAFGRRTVYLASFALFVLWNSLSAISTSIGMFIIMRVLSGGCSAAVQSVGAGTVADIWHVRERGRAMGIFYLGPLCGPLISPVVGGALSETLGWRSTQWFQTIFGGVVLILVTLLLPETHRTSFLRQEQQQPATPSTEKRPPLSRVSSHRSIQSVKKTTHRWSQLAFMVFVEPLSMITYLRFPAVALTVYYAAISFGSLYFLNISVESTFSQAPYNFKEIIVGCLYLFNSVGYFLASLLGGPWIDRIMAREARAAGRVDARGRLQYRPEDRLRENAWVAAFLMPASLLWYGWSVQYHVYWLCPMVANFLFGIGSMLLFGTTTTMLTEFMPKRSSAGVAVNNFVRNIFAFIATFTTQPAIAKIGNGWLFTIVAIISLASCFVIPTMRHFGPRWRVQMDKAMA